MPTAADLGFFTFTLKDAKGQPHEYESHLISGGEGMCISFELIRALGEPLGAFLGDIKSESETSQMDFRVIGSALGSIDPAKLAKLTSPRFGVSCGDSRQRKTR